VGRRDGRARGYPNPGLQTSDVPDQGSDASPIVSQGGNGRVVDLDLERRRRLLRALRLDPTVPVPCSGVCRCWAGVPLGGWGA
jgi:hypothetical protein